MTTLIDDSLRAARHRTTSSKSPGATAAVYRGEPAEIHRSLVEIFIDTVSSFPGEMAIDDGRERRTYGELARDAEEVVGQLRSIGVGVGDRVAVRVESGTNRLYTAILGVLC